jgi:hypothetical protein
LKTNESATVTWRFNSRVEYIKPGSRLIFREGTSKGMGEVTEIVPYESESGSSSDEIRSMGRVRRRLASRKSKAQRLSHASPDHKAKIKRNVRPKTTLAEQDKDAELPVTATRSS